MNTADLFDRWVARLRRQQPDALAILCHGSYARDAAEAHSDLDLDILLPSEPPIAYRSAFEELADGRLLHATIQMLALTEWLADRAEPGESEAWAFYLPARETARLLWATPAAAAQLADRLTLELQASPQLQDLIECAAKVRNALNRDDDLGVRQAAQGLALRAPALLALLNPPVCVESPRLALQAALDLGLVPAGYRDDMLCCLGMAATAADTAAIAASALRLAHGVITMLRANPTLIAGWVEPGLPEALSDGRLERLLTQ